MLGIFLHDLGRLARNPFALIVAVTLVVLPSVYAWCSIAAQWNPYDHADGLKVAVVNDDAGIALDDVKGLELSEKAEAADTVDVGSMLVDAMREDTSFDWQFVDADQGDRGLYSGEYYAEFVFPESFSADFLSVLSGDPSSPIVEYRVNERHHAGAPGTDDASGGVVDALVNRVFSALVADAMNGIVKDVASDLLDTGASVNTQERVGLAGATTDLRNVEAGLETARSAIESWHDAVDDAHSSLDRLKKSAPTLRDSLEDAQKILADVRTASHEVASTYASTLAEGGPELSKLLSQVAQRVSAVAEAIEDEQPGLATSLQRAKNALDASDRLIAALKRADPDSDTLVDLEDQNDALGEELDELAAASEAIGKAADKANDAAGKVADEVDEAIKNLQGNSDEFNAKVLPQLDSALDATAIAMGSLIGALDALEAQIGQSNDLLDEVDGVLAQVQGALDATAESLDGVSESLQGARADLAILSGSQTVSRLAKLVSLEAKSYGAFMASPVTSELNAVYPLNSYGTGVAPFYTSLAIWIGCLMLIAVLKLEVDPKRHPGMRPWQGHLGRLLLFLFFALLQGATVTIGDLVIGVDAFGPVSLVVAGLLAAFCFTSIVYALAITFGHAGEALAVIFLIVQIPEASGMYPHQLMPDFFQALHPWLPFTYSMGAMSEAIGGFYGNAYLLDLAWLLACGVGTLALALLVRPALLNVCRLFDRKLNEADLYITGPFAIADATRARHPLATVQSEADEGRVQLQERVRSLSHGYAVVKQAAPIAIVALTVALGLLSALLNLNADGKLIALVVYIAAMAIVFCACIAFEYARDNLHAQIVQALALPTLSADEPTWEDVEWVDNDFDAGGETSTSDGIESEIAEGSADEGEGLDGDASRDVDAEADADE